MPKKQPEYIILDDLSSKDSANLAAGLERGGWVPNRAIEKFADKLTVSESKKWSKYLASKGLEVLVTRRAGTGKRQVWKRVNREVNWR